MREGDALAISRWHYPEPYAFYDADRDPDDLAELLDPASWADRYHAAVDEESALVGYFSFEPDGDSLRVGLGLRPDLCGLGLGLGFLLAGLAYARERYTPQAFRLAVATFNRRAIRVYENAGFRPIKIFGNRTNGGEYHFLEIALDA